MRSRGALEALYLLNACAVARETVHAVEHFHLPGSAGSAQQAAVNLKCLNIVLIEVGWAQEGTQPSHPHWLAGGGTDEHATAADMQRFCSEWPCELAGAPGAEPHTPHMLEAFQHSRARVEARLGPAEQTLNVHERLARLWRELLAKP